MYDVLIAATTLREGVSSSATYLVPCILLIFAQYFTSQAPSARSISSSRTKSPSSSQTVIKINLSSPPLRVYSSPPPIDPDSAARTNSNRYDRFESINDVARGGKFHSRHFFHIFFSHAFSVPNLSPRPASPPDTRGGVEQDDGSGSAVDVQGDCFGFDEIQLKCPIFYRTARESSVTCGWSMEGPT